MPRGQELCLERLANDVTKAGKIGCVLLAEHEVYDTNNDVVAGDAIARKIYWKGNWFDADGSTVSEYLERFIEYVDRSKK